MKGETHSQKSNEICSSDKGKPSIMLLLGFIMIVSPFLCIHIDRQSKRINIIDPSGSALETIQYHYAPYTANFI